MAKTFKLLTCKYCGFKSPEHWPQEKDCLLHCACSHGFTYRWQNDREAFLALKCFYYQNGKYLCEQAALNLLLQKGLLPW